MKFLPVSKRYCLVTIQFFLVAIFAACISQLAHSDDRPNIIFLMADDQCTYSMGCYGTPDVKTPNLDKLASEGMIFDRHYVSTAICMASRVNVMTGQFEYKHGCNFMHGPLVKDKWRESYPILLKKAGYRIGFAGKFGFEVAPKPNTKGILPESDFDRWGGGPGQTYYETSKNKSMKKYAKDYPHSTLSYGAFASDFIRDFGRHQPQNKKPFCLSISFKAPHRPVAPDPRFETIYRGMKFTKPANYGREFGSHFSPQSKTGRQFERFHSWDYSKNYDGVMSKYHQQIYAIDVAVGMIRKALRETDQEDNTVLIYTSDNGFFCGSHGYGSKVLPYEESSRVPLIIFDPRHENSGKKIRCGELTGNVDFAPTILALGQAKRPDSMDGKNLMRLYDDPESSLHDSLPLINVWGPTSTFSLAVVTRDAKYIYWPFENEKMKPTEEFYDLRRDPLELKNLSHESSKIQPFRTMYDRYVADWRTNGVKFNRYEGLDAFFQREKSRRKSAGN